MSAPRATSLTILVFLTLFLSVPSQAHAVLINPDDFVSEVDNPFFPLKPGRTFFYEGTRDGAATSDKMFVTHKTKKILGVNTTVVYDRAFDENGVLAEDTTDWYAQDKIGNVWYFGEDTKEVDEFGHVITREGTWKAGVNGAQPGIIMEAHPHVGDVYQQEFAPGVAEDGARVLSLDESACVSFGCFDHLLLTEEQTPLHPGEVEWKYFAKDDVGFILGDVVQGGSEHSELVRSGLRPVPEPASFILLASGLLGFAVRRRRPGYRRLFEAPYQLSLFTFSRTVLSFE